MTKQLKRGARLKGAQRKGASGAGTKPPANNLPLVGALKLREACAYLGGIHPASLRRLVLRGLIRPNRVLRHNLFPISELNRLIEEGMVE